METDCNKTFSRIDNMRQHSKVHHKVQADPIQDIQLRTSEKRDCPDPEDHRETKKRKISETESSVKGYTALTRRRVRRMTPSMITNHVKSVSPSLDAPQVAEITSMVDDAPIHAMVDDKDGEKISEGNRDKIQGAKVEIPRGISTDDGISVTVNPDPSGEEVTEVSDDEVMQVEFDDVEANKNTTNSAINTPFSGTPKNAVTAEETDEASTIANATIIEQGIAHHINTIRNVISEKNPIEADNDAEQEHNTNKQVSGIVEANLTEINNDTKQEEPVSTMQAMITMKKNLTMPNSDTNNKYDDNTTEQGFPLGQDHLVGMNNDATQGVNSELAKELMDNDVMENRLLKAHNDSSRGHITGSMIQVVSDMKENLIKTGNDMITKDICSTKQTTNVIGDNLTGAPNDTISKGDSVTKTNKQDTNAIKHNLDKTNNKLNEESATKLNNQEANMQGVDLVNEEKNTRRRSLRNKTKTRIDCTVHKETNRQKKPESKVTKRKRAPNKDKIPAEKDKGTLNQKMITKKRRRIERDKGSLQVEKTMDGLPECPPMLSKDQSLMISTDSRTNTFSEHMVLLPHIVHHGNQDQINRLELYQFCYIPEHALINQYLSTDVLSYPIRTLEYLKYNDQEQDIRLTRNEFEALQGLGKIGYH